MNANIKQNNAVSLHGMAQKYADHHFNIYDSDGNVYSPKDNPVLFAKHDVAFHSYCDGFNAAMRILMSLRNLEDPCLHHGDDPNFDVE